jgi:hypothetical protein
MRALSAALFATATFFASEARSETGANDTYGAEPDADFTHFTVTANPLSLVVRRIGINLEYVPVMHHAIVLSPFGQFASVDGDNQRASYTNYGVELGYHWYSGTHGANGFFAGPSLLYMMSDVTVDSSSGGATTQARLSYRSYGGALDVGGQHIFKNGITLGGGVGVMYVTQTATASLSATSATVKMDGVVPRLLFTAGYSF